MKNKFDSLFTLNNRLSIFILGYIICLAFQLITFHIEPLPAGVILENKDLFIKQGYINIFFNISLYFCFVASCLEVIFFFIQDRKVRNLIIIACYAILLAAVYLLFFR